MGAMVYEDGRLSNPDLADYLIPSIEDLPADYAGALLESSSDDP